MHRVVERNIKTAPSQTCAKRWEKLYNEIERRARKTPLWVSDEEFTLFSVWDVAPFVCGGRQWDGFLRAPGDGGQFASQLKNIQLLANELCSRLPFGTIFFSKLVGKFQELLGNGFRLGKTICFVLCQDIPDRHQELSCNRNNRLVASQARFQASQFCLPVQMRVGCHLGCLDQGHPQVTSARFGDPSCPAGHATVMNFGSQTGIPHQMLCIFKALTITDRCPNRHSLHHTKAW